MDTINQARLIGPASRELKLRAGKFLQEVKEPSSQVVQHDMKKSFDFKGRLRCHSHLINADAFEEILFGADKN